MQSFNYHQHTYRCKHADLDMKDEEYILEYIKMGFKKIAFTDHCPEKNEIDKNPKARMTYSERKEYLNSIKKLKEKYIDKIEIESGYEVEYVPQEKETIKQLKKETDKIILGQHFIFNDNNDFVGIDFKKREVKFKDAELIRYVEYINEAIELGIPDIIAHPDVFMLARNEFGGIEAKASNMICKSVEKYDIPLEINLNDIFKNTYYENKKINNLPIEEQRKKLRKVIYPCKEFWEIVSNYNIKVLYGLDVHHRGHIPLFNELVQLANEIIGNETINKLNFVK